MKRWLIAFGGMLLVAALAILGRDGRQLKRVEAERDKQLAKRTDAGKAKANALNQKATAHKNAAAVAAQTTKSILETRDEKDPDMADLLSDWRSKRVRK